MELTKLKQIIEAALMASGEVLSIERMQLLFDEFEKPKSPVIKEALEGLMDDYAERGIELVEVASGYRLQVRKEVAPWVTRLWDEKPQRYSRALLETLSLIAYRQPITRGDIEDVRGVAVSSHIIRTLLDREWVRVVGHRDVPGRPAMYATTKEFLDYFSLKSLDELPSLDEIREMDDANQNLDLINAEKKASATREYDFASEEEVAARGEEVLAETELELEEAEKIMQQVEDNVFNKPSEEELAAEREAERQALAEEERLAEEASAEKKLADKFAQPSIQPSFADMANKTEQRLSSDTASDNSPSSEDLADRIADHQARLAGLNQDQPKEVISEENETVQDSLGQDSSGQEVEEELTLLQQQERLMQQLMQEEAERQAQLRSNESQGDAIESSPLELEAQPDIEIQPEFETQSELETEVESLASSDDEQNILEQEAEAELLAEAEAERALLEQEAAAERELLEQEALEKEALEKEALEQEASKNESLKKNSLFDD